MRAITVFAVVAVASAWAASATAPAPDLARHFAGIEGTFVLLDGATGTYTRYNDARAAERYAPCSTFKIPNTAVLLETGAAPDPEYLVHYDPSLHISNPDWARDHTLRSAFKVSAMWYYQAVSRRAGLAAEDRFVHQFKYGNENTSGGLDRTGNPFWIDGSLRISANEQVQFLQRMHDNQLGLSERTMRLTKEIALAEETPTYRLSAKTGACHPAGEDVVLWYVGWVERAQGVSYFALNMSDTTYDRLWAARVSKTREILTDLGVLR